MVTAVPDPIYDRTIALSSQVDEQFLELGKHLRKLYEKDPDLFKKAVDATDLGSRKAYYLLEISQTFDKLSVPPSRLKKVGWTKLMLLSKHITKANAIDMIKIAEANTVQQLKAILNGEEPQSNAHCVLLYFTPEEFQSLESALVKFGAKRSGRGLLHKEQALMALLKSLRH